MSDDTIKERLDQLQSEAERLLSLLKDREVGLFTWWEMLNRRVEAIENWRLKT